VVIKYGGHAMGEEQVAKLFAADACCCDAGRAPVFTAAARRSPPAAGRREVHSSMACG
jgi:hypothetical protein